MDYLILRIIKERRRKRKKEVLPEEELPG